MGRGDRMTTLRQHQQHAARSQATRPPTDAQRAARSRNAAKATAARLEAAALRQVERERAPK